MAVSNVCSLEASLLFAIHTFVVCFRAMLNREFHAGILPGVIQSETDRMNRKAERAWRSLWTAAA